MKLPPLSSSVRPPLEPGSSVAQTPQPASDATQLVEGVGKQRLSISRHSDGQIGVTLSRPAVSELVLSGGGVKGVAYSGAVQALESKDVLKDVQVISGSSAGGIYAVMLASGMKGERFDWLADTLQLPRLLDSEKSLINILQNTGSAVGNALGQLPQPVGHILQTVATLFPRLQSAAEPLETMIRNESRAAALAHIADLPRDVRSAQTMVIADKLSAGGALTFGDLEVLSRQIPAIKQLNITGTALFKDRPQLVVFNASLTPDLDIARAAHISGSLPFLFKAPVETGQGFQVTGESTAFQDGGILLNTPVMDMFDHPPHRSELSDVERLVLRLDDAAAPLKKGGNLLSAAADGVLGTPFTARGELMLTRLNEFADQTVHLPFKTALGDFGGTFKGTINFTMPLEVKNLLQKHAFDAISEHLDARAQLREQHLFDSADSAVLAMDDAMLAEVEPALEHDRAFDEVLRFRREARPILAAVERAIVEGSDERFEMTPALASALRNLDCIAVHSRYRDWLAIQLNAPDNSHFQRLLQSSFGHVSSVLSSGMDEMKQRDVSVKAEHFIREVIYPGLFLVGQPESNKALLRRAERDLKQATTPQQFNQALDDIVKHYVARNKPWGKPVSSTTVENARAWRLPV